jgi:quercetin dioxygenase-like cupin family protein
MGNNFSINIVNFSAGARNKMHIHTSDQVLFVTAGKGIIATEATEEVITTGYVVHVSAGEKHWHGAAPDSAFFPHRPDGEGQPNDAGGGIGGV